VAPGQEDSKWVSLNMQECQHFGTEVPASPECGHGKHQASSLPNQDLNRVHI